jgi:hypothetical protein
VTSFDKDAAWNNVLGVASAPNARTQTILS